MLGVVGKADGGGAAGNGGRLVVGGVGDGEAVAGGHVALHVIGEGRVDRAAGDGGDSMRPGLPGGRIGVGADIGLGGEVADGVVGEGLDQRGGRQRHRRRGQPVELIVDEGLVERRVGVRAGEQLAEQVVGVGVALHGPGAARGDAGQGPGVGIEGAAGDDAVAGGLLGEMSFRVADHARLGRVGGMLSNRCRRRRGRPPPLWSRQSHGATPIRRAAAGVRALARLERLSEQSGRLVQAHQGVIASRKLLAHTLRRPPGWVATAPVVLRYLGASRACSG